MTSSDRRGLGRAAKLLAKAESTDSPEEAVALALRAYSLVADWLNLCEREAGGGPRRRERRLLRDRRSLWRAWRAHVPGWSTDPGAPRGSDAYGRQGGPEAPTSIDLRA